MTPRSDTAPIAISINRAIVGKPKDPPPGLFKTPFKPGRLEARDLRDVLTVHGYAIAPVFRGPRRTKATFRGAQHIALDFDGFEGMRDAEARAWLLNHPLIADFAALIYSTPSHTPEAPRYRVLYLLDQPITDRVEYERCTQALTALFPLADQATTDAARLFYGNPGALVILDHPSQRLPRAALIALAAETMPQEAPPRPSAPPAIDTSDRARQWAGEWATRKLDELRSTSEGGRNNATNKTAYAIAQLAGSGLLDATWQEAIVSAAQSAGLPEFEARNATGSGWRAGWQVAPDWLPDFSARRLSVNSLQIAQAAADDAIHYPLPWPVTTTRTLLTAKRQTVDHEDLAGWHVIDQVHSACRMPARVTVAEYVRLANEGGWPVDRRLVSTWLAWGSEQGMYKNLPIAEHHRSNRLKNVHRYEFLPLRQRLEALGAYLAPRVTAPQLAPAKAGEIAALLGQSAEGLDAIDAARADTLAAAAEEREQHERRAAHWLAFWRGNIERILSGNYQAHDLAPQPMSAPRLRQALAAQMITEDVEVTPIVKMTGLSRPKVLDLAREAGYESVPQTETVPVDEVNEAVRARGLVISEQDGEATIRKPNVLKPIDKLTAEEQRAASEQRAIQRGLARRRLERPRDALEARWRRQDISHARAAERAAAALVGLHAPEHRRPPRDRLDLWLDHQWELAPPLSPPPIDPETGEVYKGRARWLAAFEIVRGGPMTFIQFSIPRESEAAPAPEPAPEKLAPSGTQEGGDTVHATPAPQRLSAPPAIVTYIDGMPYTAVMLERRARRLAGQGGDR